MVLRGREEYRELYVVFMHIVFEQRRWEGTAKKYMTFRMSNKML